MKLFKYIIALVAITLLAINAQARTVEIKISQCSKPLAVGINNVSKTLAPSDKLILNFDKKGEYVIDRTVRVKCDFEMKGLGKDKIKIILTEGVDNNGRKQFANDCYFFLDYPKNGNRGEVSIHDVNMEMVRHNNIWWSNHEMHLFKICNANKVMIQNTKTSVHNAFITNFDLRSCSNVTVVGNEIINYNNNSNGGGCLWMRDNQRNVVVRNNVFRKFGKDETIGIWGAEKHGNYVIENIDVNNNTFYHGNYMNLNVERGADMIFTLSHYHDAYVDDSRFKISNVSFHDNDFILDYPMKFVVLLKFDRLATTSNLRFYGNNFNKSSKCAKLMTQYMCDFRIEDQSSTKSKIEINDNTSTCERIDVDQYGLNCNVFLSVSEGIIEANNNVLDSKNGLKFLNFYGAAGEIYMTGNQVKGLYNLASISNSNGYIENVTIKARDNEFSGDTRVYFKNVKKGNLEFLNNVYNANNYHIFMQESPEDVSVVFENNVINSTVGSGTLCANYSGKRSNFKKVSVKNNTFNGISNGNSVLGEFSKSSNKSIQGNMYYKR